MILSSFYFKLDFFKTNNVTKMNNRLFLDDTFVVHLSVQFLSYYIYIFIVEVAAYVT